MHAKGAKTDARIAEIAAEQHGVVARAQLEAAGVGRGAIDVRIRRGSLHRVHRGVYAVGHEALSEHGRWLAAVLALGKGAVLSHASAAALWSFLRPEPGAVDVSLPSLSGRRRRDGIRIHRTSLPARDLTRRSDILVTTPRRTIHDIQRTLPTYLVRKAAREAQHIGYRVTLDRSRSDLELDFASFCRSHGLPSPELNVRVGDTRIGPLTVDFLWPAHCLVVETDSFEFHQGDVSFEDDHARDLALRHLGLDVLRYTGRQLEREGPVIAAELRARLAVQRPGR